MFGTTCLKLESPALDSIAVSLSSGAKALASGLSVLLDCRVLLNQIASNQEKLMSLQTSLDAQTADLATKVGAETTVVASAAALIGGFGALLQAAIDKATAAGATPAQLASLNTLGDTIDANNQALAAAVAANTAAPQSVTTGP